MNIIDLVDELQDKQMNFLSFTNNLSVSLSSKPKIRYWMNPSLQRLSPPFFKDSLEEHSCQIHFNRISPATARNDS